MHQPDVPEQAVKMYDLFMVVGELAGFIEAAGYNLPPGDEIEDLYQTYLSWSENTETEDPYAARISRICITAILEMRMVLEALTNDPVFAAEEILRAES